MGQFLQMQYHMSDLLYSRKRPINSSLLLHFTALQISVIDFIFNDFHIDFEEI